MSDPAASTITPAAVLEMLDGPKRSIAEGVLNDNYVFWLGSGISRDRMPDLGAIAKRLLTVLQQRIDQADDNCRYRIALRDVLSQAPATPADWEHIDLSKPADQWLVFDDIARRLVANYARMLNVSVEGEEADFLLWDVLDAAAVYSDRTVLPDAEHLCLAALAIEGVASEIPSANWDPLIERAVTALAGTQPVIRVVVAPADARKNRKRINLYKFHGCAEAARDNPNEFRSLLVARQSQINAWIANNPAIGGLLTQFAVTKSTLMLGLSAQDSNIQNIFAGAQAQMSWRWPSNPPAYAFSENALGADQEGLLQNVYRLDYTPANRPMIKADALVQAYAKPLLLALLLFVITSKLELLITVGYPAISKNDRDQLSLGLLCARNLIADAVKPNAEAVLKMLEHLGRAVSMFRDGAVLVPSKGIYSPISTDPLDSMPADPALTGSGSCEAAVATALIGLGLERKLWTTEHTDLAAVDSGAIQIVGRSGRAKVYFASSSRAAIQLALNGHVETGGDTVIVHSDECAPVQSRLPRRAPGRTGLASLREVSMLNLLAAGTEIDDLMQRFRNEVAL